VKEQGQEIVAAAAAAAAAAVAMNNFRFSMMQEWYY
jgi:hypothetical protein